MEEIKLTLFSLVVQEEIDSALDSIRDYHYYQAFTPVQWQRQLSEYVNQKVELAIQLNKNRLEWQILHKIPYHSLELRLCLENYIYEGIEALLGTDLNLHFRGNYQSEVQIGEPAGNSLTLCEN